PEYIARLELVSGIGTDFRRQGTIALAEPAMYPPAKYTKLANNELLHLEPHVDSQGREAYFIQEDTVDPRLLMQAALLTAQSRGVEIRGHTEVRAIRSDGNLVVVETTAETLHAKAAVNCRGAWSGVPVKPRKGQMLYVRPERHDLLRHVVHAPDVYIVPR